MITFILFLKVWIILGWLGLAIDLLLRKNEYLNSINRAHKPFWAFIGVVIGMFISGLCGPLQVIGTYILWRKANANHVRRSDLGK